MACASSEIHSVENICIALTYISYIVVYMRRRSISDGNISVDNLTINKNN